MIKAIGDNIVELSFIAVAAFTIWGMGYLIVTGEDRSAEKYELCVSKGMEWIEGNCTK